MSRHSTSAQIGHDSQSRSDSRSDSSTLLLREQLKHAISTLDLPRARELSQRLEKTETDDTDGQFTDLRQDFDRNLDVLATSYCRQRARLIRFLHSQELSERRSIDFAVEVTRSRHLLQLSDLQSSLFVDFGIEMSKPIPHYNDLLSQARASASRQDFDRAETEQNEAEAVREAELARRKEKFEKGCKIQLTECLRQQEAELEGLEKRLEEIIANSEKERNEILAKERSRFRKEMARKYKIANEQLAALGKDRSFAIVCQAALDDIYRSALLKYGFEQPQEIRRSPLVATPVKNEPGFSLKMQTRLETPNSHAGRSGTGMKSGAGQYSRSGMKSRE
jgi:hypothetical protein